jgi:hypothetical protein
MHLERKRLEIEVSCLNNTISELDTKICESIIKEEERLSKSVYHHSNNRKI